MRKKILAVVSALVFSLSIAGMAIAGECTGEVTKVEGNNVTVKCSDGTEMEATGAAKVGEKVTVKDGKIEAAKAAPKKKKIEGC
ncbi:MAG: selenite/tellurite reduction operon protein ExtJ [Dissulfurimicrobium sp.]|uniref:selenite/tellurite reduction operon protein ExtJ n=1 Tax=Dissulfurimicrobium TaxID=1769732 RepID=UPI001EDA5064|nr:hypothetical protein [Dissulfurimicrobium hydrothermale]UKL14400.1 hypothetical protein LGS26_03960 [Dissulfurimicrobium hydrothermale]